MTGYTKLICVGLTIALLGVSPVPAEVVEEIVAWVNGDIITRSEYEGEEQQMVAEVYRRSSPEEREAQVEALRKGLLMRMIDRKILSHYAQRLYDVDRMGAVFLDAFKEQQGVESDEELQKLAESDGLTVDEVKGKLIEMFAPEEVIRFEVQSRIAVGDREVEEFYVANPETFLVPTEVSLREIVITADDDDDRADKRDKAESARARVLAGESFAEVAGEMSDAPTGKKGGELGTFREGELSDVLEQAAFSSEQGAISDVIEAPYGFHLLLVESRVDEHVRPLDETREQIRDFLQDRKFQAELAAFIEKARDEAEWCVKSNYQHLLDVPSTDNCRL